MRETEKARWAEWAQQAFLISLYGWCQAFLGVSERPVLQTREIEFFRAVTGSNCSTHYGEILLTLRLGERVLSTEVC